jgi:hypothetical protein
MEIITDLDISAEHRDKSAEIWELLKGKTVHDIRVILKVLEDKIETNCQA